jgi:hypothetical protein
MQYFTMVWKWYHATYISPWYESDTMLRIFHHDMKVILCYVYFTMVWKWYHATYISPWYESDTMLRIFHHGMKVIPCYVYFTMVWKWYHATYISPWYESDTMLHIFHCRMEILQCNISPWYMYIIYTDHYVYILYDYSNTALLNSDVYPQKTCFFVICNYAVKCCENRIVLYLKVKLHPYIGIKGQNNLMLYYIEQFLSQKYTSYL